MHKNLYKQLPGKPTSAQKSFINSKARFTFFGGPRGGGKTWAMRRLAVKIADETPGVRVLLLSKTKERAYMCLLKPLLHELRRVKRRGKRKVLFYPRRSRFVFTNGSSIEIGFYGVSMPALYNRAGQEYGVIAVDGAEDMAEEQMQYCIGMNRHAVNEQERKTISYRLKQLFRRQFTPRMYFTGTPGGKGDTWIKRLFVDRQYHDHENAEDYVYIPCTIDAGLLRNDEAYMKALNGLPEDLRKKYLYGEW